MSLLAMFRSLFEAKEYVNTYPICTECNVHFEYCACSVYCQEIACPNCNKDLLDQI